MDQPIMAYLGGCWKRVISVRDRGNRNVKVLIKAGGRMWWGPVQRERVRIMGSDGKFHRI